MGKRRLGGQHPRYAQNRSELALLYEYMAQFDKVEPLLSQAAAIYKASVGEEHLDYAEVLKNLAVLYSATGQYRKAEPLYLQRGAIIRKLHVHESRGYSLNLAILR